LAKAEDNTILQMQISDFSCAEQRSAMNSIDFLDNSQGRFKL